MTNTRRNMVWQWSFLAAALLGVVAGCHPPTAASSHEPATAQMPEQESLDHENAEPVSDAPTEAPGKSNVTEPTATPAESAPADSVQPSASPKVNRPPRADRLPSKPGEAEKITFDDLNLQMLANIVFRPFMVNDRVRELEGKRISISGFMHGAAAGLKGVDEFVLLKNTECKFGQDGQADHLARVFLKDGTKANYTRSDIKIEGTLRVEPFTGPDGNTWSVYNIEDAVIR